MAWEWYAASIMMLAKFKDGNQNKYPVLENIFMIKASSADDALKKSEILGREQEGDCDGTFTWENRPVEWVFVGIRKILDVCSFSSKKNILTNGAEVTYSQFELDNEESFRKLVNGEDVMLLYKED